MSKIVYLKGDATHPIQTEQGIRIIAHIVNDADRWGKGFTYTLNKRWAKPQAKYREWMAQVKYSHQHSLGFMQLIRVEPGIFVANMCAQHGISYTGEQTVSYTALTECLHKLIHHLGDDNYSMHMPRIGAGLGGGSWHRIEQIIEETLCAHDIPVYVYDLR